MIHRFNHGFTIVELMVTMAVAGILVVATTGLYLTVLGQLPIVNARNNLSTNLQTALNRINDDVRLSSNVTTYNRVPDPDAPMNKTGYENVPGPDVDTNDQYFWRMGPNRLLLNETPVDNSGNAIYDNAAYAVGTKNTIIYYVSNGALYRRTVAAPYALPGPVNSVTTTSCARVTTGGCIGSDIKVVDNLDPSLGQAAFVVNYYDKNGNQIPYTSKDSTGNDIPDYNGFPQARSIGVTIKLVSGQIIDTQTVSLANSMRMQFRSQQNFVPPVVINPPYVPPTNGLGDPGLMAGPGGLTMFSGLVQGGDVYVKGKLNMILTATIGGNSPWYVFGLSGNGVPVNLNVGNVACGGGATFPQPCGSGSPPITLSAAFSHINGNVCAKDQIDPTNIQPYGTATRGLISGCVPPDADLPSFDKASFTSSMTNGSSNGASGSCFGGSVNLLPNHTYTSDVTMDLICNATINGNAYFTGNLSANWVNLKVSESVGNVRPIIVVNGKFHMGTSTKIIPNSYGTTPYFISFYSADSACSASPSCNTISPANLQTTITNFAYTGAGGAPISLGGSASGSSFYAYFGQAYISIFGTVGAVAGQSIYIDQGASVLLNGSL